MNFRSTTKHLLTVIGSRYTVAAHPDFPHLIAGPDLILGRDGKLFAIFIPRVAETKNPDQLLFRLAISRLGLPNHLTSVLILNGDRSVQRHLHNISWHFDGVFGTDDLDSLGLFLLDGRSSSPVSEKVRILTLVRSARLLDMSLKQRFVQENQISPQELMEEIRAQPDFEPVRVTSWSRDDNHQRRKIDKVPFLFSSGQRLVAAASFKSQHRGMAKLKTLCRLSMMLEYDLDRGVPLLKHPRANVLVVDRLPVGRFDPLKPIRAAAFAGWSITRAQNLNEVKIFSEQALAALTFF